MSHGCPIVKWISAVTIPLFFRLTVGTYKRDCSTGISIRGWGRRREVHHTLLEPSCMRKRKGSQFPEIFREHHLSVPKSIVVSPCRISSGCPFLYAFLFRRHWRYKRDLIYILLLNIYNDKCDNIYCLDPLIIHGIGSELLNENKLSHQERKFSTWHWRRM